MWRLKCRQGRRDLLVVDEEEVLPEGDLRTA